MRTGVAAAVLGLGLGVAAPSAAADWPAGAERIEIRSSLDGSMQPAMLVAPPRGGPAPSAARPLLVALHTWSSSYDQPLSAEWAQAARARGFVSIHPDYRGPNTGPQAGGSEAAIRDVLDAVAEARRRAAIDPKRIYLAGFSGGGHAALLVATKSPDLWAGVSTWSAITDLTAWHAESRARRFTRYVNDIEALCGGPPDPGTAAEQECDRRSPLSFLQALRGVPVDLNTGIRDGHAPKVEAGTLPIGHSLRAFNLLAAPRDRIPAALVSSMEARAEVPPGQRFRGSDASYGAKRVLLRRQSGAVRVTLFDGDHEMIPEAALDWLSRQRRR